MKGDLEFRGCLSYGMSGKSLLKDILMIDAFALND